MGIGATACSLTPLIALLHCVADDHVLESGRCVLGKWVAFMLTVGQEASLLTEINARDDIRAVAFAADGKYLINGGWGDVRVWRVEDGKQMSTLEAEYVWCLAVSKDGRWITAGTSKGEVIVWDAKTFKNFSSHRDDIHKHQRSRFLARLDSTRLCVEQHSLHLGPCNSPTNTNTRTRVLDEGSQVFATRRSDRDSHPRFRSSLGQQRRPLAQAHQSNSHPVVQHWSPLVQQPPPCHIQQQNQAIRSIHRVRSLGMASSRWHPHPVHRSTKAWGVHRILDTAYRHILGHGDTQPARSHPTPSKDMFNRTLTRRPVSRNWWRGRENRYQ